MDTCKNVLSVISACSDSDEFPPHWWLLRNRLYEYRNGFLLMKTKTYKLGDIFYQKALLKNQETCPETTRTIEAETLLIALSNKAFLTCKAKVQRKKLDAMIEFYASIPALQILPKLSLEKLFEKSIKNKYERKQIVYKEGDLTQFVYIVWKGEFELSRNLPKINSESGGTNGIGQLLGNNYIQKKKVIEEPKPEVEEKKDAKKKKTKAKPKVEVEVADEENEDENDSNEETSKSPTKKKKKQKKIIPVIILPPKKEPKNILA